MRRDYRRCAGCRRMFLPAITVGIYGGYDPNYCNPCCDITKTETLNAWKLATGRPR